MSMFDDPCMMSGRGRCYFTPALWQEQVGHEGRSAHEWPELRERFQATRQGAFDALDDLLELYLRLEGPDTRLFARNLLGDAGTDRHLEAVEAYVLDTVADMVRVCELCRS